MILGPTHQITLTDLQALVGNVPEGKTIEYKREMRAKTRDEVVQFLAAVSSLANTAGGDLLIGIDAANGTPIAITGLALANLDDEKLRLEQLLATQIEPRLPRVDIQPVHCGSGRHVLVIRAYRSWVAPHRVIVNDKFYGRRKISPRRRRTAHRLHPLGVDRRAHPQFPQRSPDQNRRPGNPASMLAGPSMVIHVVPLSTFAAGTTLDIVQLVATGHVMPLPPGRMFHGNNYAPNLDVLITFTNRPNEPAHAYAQIFRTGAIEGLELLTTDEKTNKPYISASVFENAAVSAIRNYLTFTKSIDLGFPVFIFLSFYGMRGCVFRTRSGLGAGYYDASPLPHDVIALPEVTLDSESTDVPTAMRLSFKTVWNAFGFSQSDKYDNQGRWIGTPLIHMSVRRFSFTATTISSVTPPSPRPTALRPATAPSARRHPANPADSRTCARCASPARASLRGAAVQPVDGSKFLRSRRLREIIPPQSRAARFFILFAAAAFYRPRATSPPIFP